MLTYKKDDFDESLDDIMSSIDEILNKKGITRNKEQENNIEDETNVNKNI